MTLAYSTALAKLLDVAQQQRRSCRICQESVPLQAAVGRIVAHNVVSPKSIPEYDTSAMDGYAIHSEATAKASPEAPVLFRVQGSIAAGDDPKDGLRVETREDQDDAEPCVEIMTGAIFPDYGPSGQPYDACVRLEDTTIVKPTTKGHGRYLLVSKHIAPDTNKRFAGNDIRKGDNIIRQGETVLSSHILPLASVGLESITVMQQPRAAVFSTGRELLNGKGATRDTNGPYLTAALRDMGIRADFLGILDDDPTTLHHHILEAADSGSYDVILTSGAVSKGRADHVRNVLEQTDAEIVFHGLAIRPGHPVLFALVPANQGTVAFFGLPGNPGAAAACFRFLTVPYLRALQGQATERPMQARLVRSGESKAHHNGCSTQAMDCFRHGVLSVGSGGQLTVKASEEQSPAKLGSFIAANCWIHFKADAINREAELVDCYPISPTGIQLSATGEC
ncbi:hypothetical protein VTK56DRAFT_6061 [Thermocarpiscus australiensis]